MYNKLFSKIVDSSIWMEPDHVRLIWLMFIAVMDEDGFVKLASVKNVAQRAVMDLEKAADALRVLESPDPESSNPANEGRRIERVPGGWMVLNANEYREIVKREHEKELNRERVRKHRSKAACNGGVMVANENVTTSDTETEAEADAKEVVERASPKPPRKVAVFCPNGIDPQLWSDWAAVRTAKRAGPITVTVMRAMQREADKAGIPLVQAIEVAAARGWQAFKADWAWRDAPKQAEYKTL